MAKYDLSNKYRAQCFDEFAKKLKEKGAWVELRKLTIPHSIDSHRLYRGIWCTAVAKDQQMHPDEVHYLYRAIYLRKPEDEILTILRKEVWEWAKDMIDQFRWFAELGIMSDIISESTKISAQDQAQFNIFMKNVQNHARINFDLILLSKKDKNFAEFYREYGYY